MKYDTDIFSLNEINVDTTQPNVRYRLRELLQSQDKFCKISYSTMQREIFPTIKKPGGTLAGIMGRWSSMFDTRGSDKQGRWSWILLNGKGSKKILLVSAYRVCQDSPSSAGQSTAYMQQYRFQLANGNKHPTPRKTFFADLTQFILSTYKKYSSVSIMMDANENIADDGPLTDFLSTTELVDIIQKINPGHAQHRPTYLRSNSRLNYIFTSRDILPQIKTAGHYLPKQLIPTADHSGLYMTISTEALFASSTIDQTHISMHMLTLHNRLIVVAYLEQVQRLFTEHKIQERLQDLVVAFSNHKTNYELEYLICKLNKLDQEKTRYMLTAERLAGKAPPQGIYEWSPALEHAGRTFMYWKVRLSLLYNKLPIPLFLEENQHDLQIVSTSNIKSYVKAKYQLAKQHLRLQQSNAVDNRQKHLQVLAEHYTQERNSTKAKELKNLIQNENIRRLAKKHKWYLKDKSPGMFDYLMIPRRSPLHPFQLVCFCYLTLMSFITVFQQAPVKAIIFLWNIPRNNFESINDPQLVNDYIVQKNTQNLLQTRNTAFTMDPLASLLGKDGETPIADQILDGRFKHDILDNSRELHEFIKALRRPTTTTTNSVLPEMDVSITLEQYKTIMTKTRESTASSPSGLHYGHYIACCESDALSQVLLTFMTLPFTYGFSLARWETSIHCMLQKESKPFLHRLRIIQLFEADFNTYTKYIFGRRLLRYTETRGVSDTESFGNRPHRSTHDALTIARLICDEARLNRRCVALLTLDLCGNYDRMVRRLTTLVTRREGIPRKTAIAHVQTLRKMKHRIRTKLGLSTQSFQATDDLLLEGLGQGNGAAAKAWLSAERPIALAYKELTNAGITITNPFNSLTTKHSKISYVDDVKLLVELSQIDFDIILGKEALKDCLDTWSRLVDISGGEISLTEKSWFQILSWKLNHGTEELQTTTDNNISLYTSSTKTPGQTIKVKQIDSTHGLRYLGVRLSCSGSDTHEYKYRLKAAKKLAGQIATTPLTISEALTVYQERWKATFFYCLPITQFTKSQCNKLQSTIFQKLLPKLGYNRHMPAVVLAGPYQYGGHNLISCWHEQHCLHIERLIRYICRNCNIGKLLTILMEQYQFFLGIHQPFLSLPSTNYQYGIKHMLQYVWDACTELQVTLHMPSLHIQPLYCVNDYKIMDKFVEKGYPPWKLRILNNIRLWLRVSCGSELFDLLTMTLHSWVPLASQQQTSSFNWPL